MKFKLLAALLVVGGSAFAQTRFSISVGGYGRGYYAPPPPVYYGQGRAYGNYGGYAYGQSGGAGYWAEDPDRQHRRAEWRGLRSHQEDERYMYGGSEELHEHQRQERHELRHEQWHERNGDYDAGEGPGHGSARDGWRY